MANIGELINAVTDFDEKNADATIETFLQDIALLTDADKSVDESKGFVTLMTIHMAKGLEFPIVHIAGCCDRIFPLIREATEDREQIEEERRLFYVGCTRAEKTLYLYYTEWRMFQGQTWKYDESRFLEEMDKSVVTDLVGLLVLVVMTSTKISLDSNSLVLRAPIFHPIRVDHLPVASAGILALTEVASIVRLQFRIP